MRYGSRRKSLCRGNIHRQVLDFQSEGGPSEESNMGSCMSIQTALTSLLSRNLHLVACWSVLGGAFVEFFLADQRKCCVAHGPAAKMGHDGPISTSAPGQRASRRLQILVVRSICVTVLLSADHHPPHPHSLPHVAALQPSCLCTLERINRSAIQNLAFASCVTSQTM